MSLTTKPAWGEVEGYTYISRANGLWLAPKDLLPDKDFASER